MDSVKNVLSPKQEKQLVELAQIFLKNEEERTKQAGYETERIKAIQAIAHDGHVTAQAAIDVLDSLIQMPDARIGYTDSNISSMSRIRQELIERKGRQKEFEPYRDQLTSIGTTKLAKLARKVRPQVAEVGLPLRNSAETLSFTGGQDRKSFATFDEDAIKDINFRSIDENSAMCAVRFVSYDKDMGTGKIDIPDESIKRLSYSLPAEMKPYLQRKILLAIDEQSVQARIRFFRNKDKTVTSAQIERIEGDEEEDERFFDDNDDNN